MTRLDRYRAKRDFTITPEPAATLARAGKGQPLFVVQKHDARRLHYDLRLEHAGVLWSWAVTKGPSDDPAEKRLAVRTEDHPVAYGDFEGTIPAGAYGGGTVMLWDRGWWEPLHDPAEGLAQGKLHFRLHGARMRGGWALVRLRGNQSRENWLLIKERDDLAGRTPEALVNRHRRSVVSGRTMRAIAAGKVGPPAVDHGGTRPRFRAVQLATLQDAPPEGQGWWHEAKVDGYRCLIAIGSGGIRLYTRNGKDWSDRFAPLCAAADALRCESALIDGEVIAGQGSGDFSALQEALKTGGALTFVAFDLLEMNGTDLTRDPLVARRAALERLFEGLPPRAALRLLPVMAGQEAELLARICAAGGEGIVSKRIDAPYRGGRGGAWIKAKCIRRAEFVIAGWMPSDKRGRPFASLLLGSHDGGRLVYRGRVGTGFDAEQLDSISARLKRLERKTPPFDGASPAEMAGARWVTPGLVAEVSYAEFTADGLVRHGVFHGLRDDKEAAEVSAKAEADTDVEAQVGGIRISSAGREVFPKVGLTKADVARHYDRVAERLLSHAGGRPLSLLRCPSGIDGECFFQKHAGKGFPAEIDTVSIPGKAGGTDHCMVLNSPEAVIAAVQMGTLEFHIWGARTDRLERPDRMVFDLDPDEGLGFSTVRDSALELRDALSGIGLQSAAMVTGGKGVHVVVPLRRTAGWDTVKGFARTFAAVLAERHPDRYTASMSKAKRKGRIFVDWLRNERGATAIAPYAMRARPGAPVAIPVDWAELETLSRANGFSVADMATRLKGPCPMDTPTPRSIGAGVVKALERWASG